jgi:hypothetical protein
LGRRGLGGIQENLSEQKKIKFGGKKINLAKKFFNLAKTIFPIKISIRLRVLVRFFRFS